MVVGEPAQAMPNSTVLALEVVAHRDVDAGELDRALAADDGPKESDHGWHLDADADRANVFVVLLDDLDLAVEDHADGTLPADDPMGLIALVQDKGPHTVRAWI